MNKMNIIAGTDSESTVSAMEEEYDQTPVKGFQNPLFCNRYLPYHANMEEEAEALLESIKYNLSRAVQKHELWPGALYWTNRLRR